MSNFTKVFLIVFIFASLFSTLAIVLSSPKLITQANFPDRGTEVIPLPPTNGGIKKDSIQLNTFPFITLAPTPPFVVIDDIGPGPKGNCGFVIDWAQKISDKLQIGGGGSLSSSGYDNLTRVIANNCGRSTPKAQWLGQYWCTWIIMDSYKLAGVPIARNPGVVAMHKWWRRAAGFKYIDYSGSKENLQQVKPGFAMFLESVPGKHNGHEHVALVKEITVDSRGNGTLITLESNASKKSKTYPVSNWKIKNTTYPARGFGGK